MSNLSRRILKFDRHSGGPLNIKGFLLLVLSLMATHGVIPGELYAQEANGNNYTFVAIDIPLSDAFDKFIERSGISVAFKIDLVEGKRAFCRAVNLSVEEAITCLLTDTELDFIQLSSGTYVLVEKAKVEAQWGELSGRVVDSESGEPLINAHVLLADAGIGDVTNGAGRFAFSRLKPGPHRVVVTYLGYQDIADTVDVAPDQSARVELGLKVELLVSSPIVVSGLVSRHSSALLDAEENKLADLLEHSTGQDVIRSINTIVGVRVGDVLADVHVQGGDAGEHQYRLDGAPAFLPIPNGGIIGPFSPFALEKLTVHKAGYTAAIGSHLSGVIEAEHRLTPLTENTFDVQVDPVSVNARAIGSLGDRSEFGVNWMVAARKALWSIYQPTELKTHFDNWSAADLTVLNSFFQNQRPDGQGQGGDDRSGGFRNVGHDMRTNFDRSGFNDSFDFYDLHGAMRIHLGPLKSVHGSFYLGGNEMGDDRVVQGVFDPLNQQQPVERRWLNFENDYNWTNTVAQLKYEHVLGNRTFAEWGGWFSRFDGVQQFDHNTYRGQYQGAPPDSMSRPPAGGFHFAPDSLASMGIGYEDTNGITEIGLRATLNHTLGERNFFTGGVEIVRDESDFVLNLQGPREEGSWEPNKATLDASQFRLAGYFDNKYSLSEKTALTLGLRLTYLDSHKQVYAEPRISIRHDAQSGPLGPWAFRGAFGVYRQYINQFDITSVNRNALIPSMRFWLPVDEGINPGKSVHLSGAFLFNPHDDWQMRLEGYYKWQPHQLVIDYANPALFGKRATSFSFQEELLHEANGFAYGAAISLSRKTDVLTTNVQYEYSVAEQQISNRFGGRSLSVPWNVPHRISTMFLYSVSDRITILGRLENKIGQSWAFRGVYYNFLEPDPNIQFPEPYNLSDPTSHKLPVISHLDFGVSFSQPLKNTLLQIRFDLSNILSYSNVEEWSLATDANNNFYKVERPLSPFLPSLVIRLGF